jgi:hypothetical protein
MTHLQTIDGEVVSVGPGQHDPGPDCYLVKELVLKDGSGTVVRLVDVVVPGAAHWMLKPGAAGRFDLLHLTYPKPLGSYLRSFLVAASCADGDVNGARNIHRWIRSSKGAAFHFLWFGLLLMPAFGFGLLLWICATKLLFVKAPPLLSSVRANER